MLQSTSEKSSNCLTGSWSYRNFKNIITSSLQKPRSKWTLTISKACNHRNFLWKIYKCQTYWTVEVDHLVQTSISSQTSKASWRNLRTARKIEKLKTNTGGWSYIQRHTQPFIYIWPKLHSKPFLGMLELHSDIRWLNKNFSYMLLIS